MATTVALKLAEINRAVCEQNRLVRSGEVNFGFTHVDHKMPCDRGNHEESRQNQCPPKNQPRGGLVSNHRRPFCERSLGRFRSISLWPALKYYFARFPANFIVAARRDEQRK